MLNFPVIVCTVKSYFKHFRYQAKLNLLPEISLNVFSVALSKSRRM